MLEQRQQLIDFLVESGGKEQSGYTWSELLDMHDIPVTKQNLKRASDWWRYFQKTGKPIPETEPIDEYQIPEGFSLKKMWVTPEGKIGKSYEYKKELTFSKETLDKINLELEELVIEQREVQYDSIGVISLADIHVGAFTKDYSLSKLESYLSHISSVINRAEYNEVVLLFPGDLIESFTGTNHNDTWKNIEEFGGSLIITAYKLLHKFFESIVNLTTVVFVEGNHDRLTDRYEANFRKGVTEVLAFFIEENSNLNVLYDPFLKSVTFGNVNFIVTHGDKKPYSDYGQFLFKYGKQGLFNLIVTGHHHRYEIKASGENFMHVQCPSLVSGHFIMESVNKESIPGFVIIEQRKGMPRLIFEPLI